MRKLLVILNSMLKHGAARNPSFARTEVPAVENPLTFNTVALPLGEGWGEGGGRRGPRTLLKPALRVTQGLLWRRLREGPGRGSCPLSRWEKVGVRAGGGGGRATLLKLPPAELRKGPPGETERGAAAYDRPFTLPHESQYVTVSAGLRVVGPKR